jgi:predicted Zn-dependent protease
MKKLHEQWKAKGLEQTKLEDQSYLKRIEGMIVGENPRNGLVENGTYYHPELTFQFSVPTDWQLVNEPSRVIMVSKDQKGVILMTLSGARSPEEAVLAVINSEGMQKVETGGPTNNNGIPGFYGHAYFESQGQKLGLMVSAVNYENKVFQFVAYTDSASYKAYNSAFVQPYQSFTKLTDSSKLSVQPTRIKLVTATEDKPFSSFLTKPLPIGTKELDWAIINQVELNEMITKGTVLKLY